MYSMLTSSIPEMTDQFEQFHIDVLGPGSMTTLPPGYIHCVVSIGTAAMIAINLVREDWLECVETASGLETALVDSGIELPMEIILDRRKRDIIMLKRLGEMDMTENRKSRLRRIIKWLEETLDKWMNQTFQI